MKREELISLIYENMSAAKRVVHSRMHAFVGDCPISRSQMELLFTLRHLQPTSPKQLAREMQLSPGAISQLIDGLVEQSLVERESDPADRRTQTVKLSATGTEKLSDIEKRRNKIIKTVVEDLNTEELQVLLKVQEKLTRKLSEINKTINK